MHLSPRYCNDYNSLLSSDSSFIAAYVVESLGCNIRHIFLVNPAKQAPEPKIDSTESIRCSFSKRVNALYLPNRKLILFSQTAKIIFLFYILCQLLIYKLGSTI